MKNIEKLSLTPINAQQRFKSKGMLVFFVFVIFSLSFPKCWFSSSFIVGNAFAQSSSTFMRTFKASGMNGGLSLAETSDGGFVGTGQHGTSGAGSCDIYVYKVDACGEPEWFKLFGGSGEDGGYSVQQTSDGGYIVAGLAHLGAGGYDMILLKLNALGIMQWSKVFGAGSTDFGLCAKETADGGFILSGFITGLGFGGTDVALIKTDALGNVQWKKVFGGTGNEWGNYVEQNTNGDFIIIGYTTSFGAGGTDIYLIKTDSAGNLLWSKTYGGAAEEANSEWGISGKITTDGGIMLCANTNTWGAGSHDLLMLKTDSIGNLLWAKTYGGPGNDQPRFAEQTSDGGFILCGFTTSYGAGDLDAYLLKTDSIGDLLWSRAYGGTGSDRGSMVREANQGGFAISTVTSSFGADYFDALFMKTDSLGIVGCNEVSCATVVNTVTPLVSSGGSEMIPAVTISIPSIIINDFTPLDEFLCKHCITIPTFVPSDNSVCVGDTVLFYNTTSVGIRCFEDWFVNGTVINGDKDTFSFVFNTSGIHVIQLIANCGNNTDTNTINIEVFDFPIAEFSSTSVCNGTATEFTDNSTIPSGTISSWNWSLGDGSPINNNQIITGGHIYNSAGNYDVTLIVSNNYGCADTVTKTVEVHFNPIANFTFNDICFKDTMYFTNTSTLDTSALMSSYLWVFGDGTATSNLQNTSHYYFSSGTNNVTLVATTADMCSDAVNLAVNIFDPPSANFSFNNKCLNDSALFTNTSINPLMGFISSWTWDFGDSSALNSTVWSPSHLYANPGIYAVTLITVSSNLGCSDTLLDSITVFPMPIADFNVIDDCLNEVISFNDSSTVSLGNIISWSWNFGDGSPLSSLQNSNHAFSSSGSSIIKIIVTSNYGCKDSISKTVIVHPLPNAQYNAANVCDDSIVHFLDLSNIPSTDTIQSWSWNFGDASPYDTNPNASHLYSNAGSYQVQLLVVSSFGCSDSITKTSIINPNPVVNFISNDTVGCEPLCILFQDSSIIAAGNTTQWLWNFGDGSPISTSQNVEHCYNNDSVFLAYNFTVSLVVKSDSGCTSSLFKSNYITVYPNPVANFIVQPEFTSIVNPVISIIDQSVGANFWFWEFGNGDTSSLSNPLPHTYADTGSYIITLIVSTQLSCFDTAFQTIVIEPDYIFYLPNAFSPNQDGINDSFSAKGLFIKKYELVIFDRWGNKIFITDDFNKPWGGEINNGDEIAVADVYIYSVKITDFKNKKHTQKGIVTLIR